MQTETLQEHAAALEERCQSLQAELCRLKAMARPRAVERHYSVSETALLLSFSERWVRDQVKAGEFAGVVEAGGELRIPASAINSYLARHEHLEPGISARSAGELRRKVARKEA